MGKAAGPVQHVQGARRPRVRVDPGLGVRRDERHEDGRRCTVHEPADEGRRGRRHVHRFRPTGWATFAIADVQMANSSASMGEKNR